MEDDPFDAAAGTIRYKTPFVFCGGPRAPKKTSQKGEVGWVMVMVPSTCRNKCYRGNSNFKENRLSGFRKLKL